MGPLSHSFPGTTGARLNEGSEIIDGSPDLSICVHGCDHTNREFERFGRRLAPGKADTGCSGWNGIRAARAWRSIPSWSFHKESSPARPSRHFAPAGYLAAVNSTAFPTGDESGATHHCETSCGRQSRSFMAFLFSRGATLAASSTLPSISSSAGPRCSSSITTISATAMASSRSLWRPA